MNSKSMHDASGLGWAVCGGNTVPRLFYTIKETAVILGVSEKSVRRLLARGILKSSPALRVKLITIDSLKKLAALNV